MASSERCLIFQQNGRILLDGAADEREDARNLLRAFAELTSAGGAYHTYRVTVVSLWSAAAAGMTADEIVDGLNRHARTAVPKSLVARIQQFFARYGSLRLTGKPGALVLRSDDAAALRLASESLGLPVVDGEIPVRDWERGRVKAAMAEAGYPVVDEALLEGVATEPYFDHARLDLRPYQREAVERFVGGNVGGGLILLPCGAGKTVVGVAIAARLGARTLVVTPSREVGAQWSRHFIEMTSLSDGDVSLFDPSRLDATVSIQTYQGLTQRRNGVAERLVDAMTAPWGLVIYDEVHSLPADVFRMSAALQSRRRLGLTATLVREDGRQRDVFALVGPPVWQSPWRQLERQGWISPVECVEIRVRLDGDREPTDDRRLAAKMRVVRMLVERHGEDRVLIAAHRLREVSVVARQLDIPAVTGQTPQPERQDLYERFRRGEVRMLALSRVANVGIDLPDASVLIQVSGAFGSRLEEAQRVGRLLRPKDSTRPARFYTIVSPDTREAEHAARRQRFLLDQGYRYSIFNARG